LVFRQRALCKRIEVRERLSPANAELIERIA
jgi:hypothetical protein